MGNWLFGWGCPPAEEDKDAQQPMLSHANVSGHSSVWCTSLTLLQALSSHDQAVLELKVQRDRLQEYQKKVIHRGLVSRLHRGQLQYVIHRENEIARQKLREGKKKQVRTALKCARRVFTLPRQCSR